MNQINANAPTPAEIMELVRENERLKAQIVKTNERVDELKSSYELLLEECHEAKARCAHAETDQEYARMHSAEFAIEQQLKGITRVLACKELNLSEGDIDTIILMKEQIRKD